MSSSSSSARPSSSVNGVVKYHNQTKHNFFNYAKGPNGLDWENQPNPFRRYISSPLLPLEQTESLINEPPLSYSSLFHSLPSSKPITHSTTSQFFYDSLALSAWKTTGFSTWSLRVNPSSGNLHPTEAYIISPKISSLCNSSFNLEMRFLKFFLQNLFPEGSFLIGFSSIFLREAWKYGERSFRYCNHDVGHAIGTVNIAAGEFGWDVKIRGFKVPFVSKKGKLPEIEFEHPDCVLVVFPKGIGEFSVDYEKLSLKISEVFSDLEWKGKANALSKEHVCWDIIYKTAESVKKPLTRDEFYVNSLQRSGLNSEEVYRDSKLREIIRKRRSAVDMDMEYVMERETFYQILLHCLPSVSRLQKGSYFLVRNEDHFDEIKRVTRNEFEWEKPEGCPADLPLYILALGDHAALAQRLSCHQKNAWMYPRLFWETGILGQILYLEAHAVGISATGIGCYFDDSVHSYLGLEGSEYQSLYHFTVGSPVVYKRIMSLPAYQGPKNFMQETLAITFGA
ncbi:hypothetical protein MKX01_008159 [Papaver californicum]|nr:hypothetical protein MKX01_008159 [Papaver californicum]